MSDLEVLEHATTIEVPKQISSCDKIVFLKILFYLCRYNIIESFAVQTIMSQIRQSNKFHGIWILRNLVCFRKNSNPVSLFEVFTVWWPVTAIIVVCKCNSYEIHSVGKDRRRGFKYVKSHFFSLSTGSLNTADK